MNNQIELSDEQLEAVLGGVTTVSGTNTQTNTLGQLLIPIVVTPTTNTATGSGNFQAGSLNLLLAGNFASQSNS